ncbi:sulfatase-like hydrolase/transferase [Gemmata sp. JC673]|uniref:Sulfatase-like hydrolase/transferase n=1 Tax=Gemmata algarum TaxID=2975278 RepID=A0ABU5F7H9_9BACT|nr:sulfatase-like hydrolase/transferase [Gemmata algarum]MDY3563149.1 sulfatase-like hydrolase/transferase [Gemmata algarum]
MRCAIAMLALAVCTPGTVRGAGAKGPNVLFLFADDQRADTIAALGNRHIRTPNLDRLVRRGVSFDRAYMQGGLNGATCVPSRAMLLSGRCLFRIDEKLLRDETWPEAFAKAGYATFATGKWHNGEKSLVRCFPEARGIFVGGMTNPLKAPLADVEGGKLTAPKLGSKHACTVFADEAIKFLNRKHEKPFFCYVPFDAPHDPHIVPDDFPIRYDAGQIPLPHNFLPQHPFNNGEMSIRDETLLAWPRDPKQVRELIAEYFRYVSYLDSEIGRVLDALDKSPHANNTIVVFAADSGVARGSHGLIGKQNCYEHSLRVPLVFAGPAIAQHKRTAAMCYLFDVLPTLGKLCGVPPPRTSEGLEFSQALADPTRAARPHLVFGYKNVQRAVRDDRWKLIRYPQVGTTQLFDLRTDPDEVTDLSAKPEHAARVKELLTLLGTEQQRFDDTAPLSVAKPFRAEWTPPSKKEK